MARGRRTASKPIKILKPRCKWCKKHRDARGFDKHQKYCKAIHDYSEQRKRNFIGPLLPGSYIRIVPHPHSTDSTPKIIPIDSPDYSDSEVKPTVSLREELYGHAPWFPFCSRADFEATEISVKGLLPKYLTNNLLNGASRTWNSTGRSRVTLKNHKEMEAALATARKYGVRFKSGEISAKYKGEMHRITFEYRDPWEWVTRLLEDHSLAPYTMFNSVRKYYCEGTEVETLCEQVIDEPNTADTWYNHESELPDADPYPHCFLPLHCWLDEGLVTKRVTMHPMVLRAVFLPGNIRNASGNGGGVLLGYIAGIPDPNDPHDRKSVETLAFAKFKMKVYQRILATVFASLRARSWNGEPVECCDKVVRIFHPGIFISSLDGKEAAYFNACRAALANYPCPKCLVHKDDLHRLMKAFVLRTPITMKKVVRKAFKANTKTEKEAILKNKGLHGIDHFLWGFRFSDPYAAYSYDTLHSDDLGKWGDHLWSLLGGKGTFAQNMRDFTRWPGLKHFNQVTTVRFTDGQSFYDILKSVLPCIVQIFPHNDPLVHCIRACQRLRIMTGMHCMPSQRLERLQQFIKDYEYWCSQVTVKYGKEFDFFKQHATSHIVDDIRNKGTTNHGSTRPGEGFQQEAAEAYNQTNFKNVAVQMNRIDETQEAIARIRMAIDKFDKQCEEDEREDEPDLEESSNTSALTSASWRFGAPDRLTNSRAFGDLLNSAGNPVKDFDSMLRDFISEHFPGEQIQPFKCAHLTYQSLEDWRGLRDIVRCNPSFHGYSRYDSILFNSDLPGLSFARLRTMFRCTLETKRQFDVAIVRQFRRSKWKPRTDWAGCQVYEETKEYSLLLMDYVMRGALLTPVTASGKDNLHYFVDSTDADMFLRADTQ
ncbi:hypothetical protein C8R43DRAFT_1177915 [Mycena crocata]|nr:hypothetical protein C8R43DRAFT_1179828 [Mycena crocata]KAJ7159183.1 hypothetical protein C8R43DRAFT_1177915 [Mycena crocata]